ncbi:DUF1853 family protein [Psychroserpens sp. BH13MA-6]
MNQDHLNHLYHAYLKTAPLWEGSTVFDLEQLALPELSESYFDRKISRRLRLGQLAEQFAFQELSALPDYEMLSENIQIQHNKHTLGELDALLKVHGTPIHLEIVYKFYVYDSNSGSHELDRWIGPNRKDSLMEKLTKLKDKQLPLLYSEESANRLKVLGLGTYNFQQQVLFKGQLFVPIDKDIPFKLLNKNCVSGVFYKKHQLQALSNCRFFLPSKLDWFLEPRADVEWMDYEAFNTKTKKLLNEHRSPLFWLATGEQLSKAFLVWW